MHSPSPTTEAGNLPLEQDPFCVQPEDSIPDAVIANKNGADEIEVDYELEEEAVQVPAKERNHKGFIDEPHTYLGQRCTGRYPPLDADTVIGRLDRNYGLEQFSSQDNPNPFLIQLSSQPLTLGSVNANCPPENRFQAYHVASSDTQLL